MTRCNIEIYVRSILNILLKRKFDLGFDKIPVRRSDPITIYNAQDINLPLIRAPHFKS